ncbi:MAG: fasciclin domain-containing protein [Fimbriimonadaceae bacterium]|nr:fasciclin domain-containing protein [Fimbriimonadaceae bacterium]QYK58510.1 MAG: fasciclin domain-containing protein [Fimbriimonadaceae bacterium]
MKLISYLVAALCLVWAIGCTGGTQAESEGSAKSGEGTTSGTDLGTPLVKDPTPEELNKELEGKNPVGGLGEGEKVTDVHPTGDGRLMLAGLKTQGAKTFLELLETSGVAKEIASSPSLTFLVPTEEAFSKMPSAELKKLKSDKAALTDFLKNHILAGYMRLADLGSTTSVATWNQRIHPIQRSGDKVILHGANFLKSEVKVGEGLMYQIDRVLPMGEKMKPD